MKLTVLQQQTALQDQYSSTWETKPMYVLHGLISCVLLPHHSRSIACQGLTARASCLRVVMPQNRSIGKLILCGMFLFCATSETVHLLWRCTAVPHQLQTHIELLSAHISSCLSPDAINRVHIAASNPQ
jgi:hypothetical protein